MAKYQTRPTVVEATQWFKPGDDPRVVEVIDHHEGTAISEFDKEVWRGIGTVKYAVVYRREREVHYVRPNDWIVKHQGISDVEVVSNSEFRKLYEPVK